MLSVKVNGTKLSGMKHPLHASLNPSTEHIPNSRRASDKRLRFRWTFYTSFLFQYELEIVGRQLCKGIEFRLPFASITITPMKPTAPERRRSVSVSNLISQSNVNHVGIAMK
jgi:hypothetical protein